MCSVNPHTINNNTMSSSETKPSSISDPYKILNLTRNPDGSLTREPLYPSSPATPHLTADSLVITLSKDIPLNTKNSTYIRLYRPVSQPTQKLPVIVYYHGGGFVVDSVEAAPVHLTCSEISAHTPAIVVSLEYRLAPEHRLPAAYEDGVEAVMWLRNQALQNALDGCDEWLNELADFSKVYLMGLSAGGNLAYNVGLRVLDIDLDPITIVGLILDQPFCGGVERTEAEIRLVNDRIFPLSVSDLMWSLALPLDCDRDHEYSNPLGDKHRSLNKTIERLPMCLIRVHEGDLMVDRQKDFANMLEARGVKVTRKFYKQGCHGAEFFDPKKAEILYDDVKSFIST